MGMIGRNKVLVKPEEDISTLNGMTIEAPEQERWSLYGVLLDLGEVIYNHRGNRKSTGGNRLHVKSSQCSTLYDNPDRPKPGSRVMYSYLVRNEPVDHLDGIIFNYHDLYGWWDGETWRMLNGYVLIEIDEKDRIESLDGMEIINIDRNIYGKGIVRYAGSPNENYLHFKAWDDPDIKVGSNVLFNKNAAYRIEIINTLTNKETSLFVAQRKDLVGLQ